MHSCSAINVFTLRLHGYNIFFWNRVKNTDVGSRRGAKLLPTVINHILPSTQPCECADVTLDLYNVCDSHVFCTFKDHAAAHTANEPPSVLNQFSHLVYINVYTDTLAVIYSKWRDPLEIVNSCTRSRTHTHTHPHCETGRIFCWYRTFRYLTHSQVVHTRIATVYKGHNLVGGTFASGSQSVAFWSRRCTFAFNTASCQVRLVAKLC